MQVALVAAVLMLPLVAGAVTIDDAADLLAPAERAALTVKQLRFEARIMTGREYSTREELDAVVTPFALQSGGFVVFVDPEHRHTVVRANESLRIDPARLDAIARAGDDAFRAGQWAVGIADVLVSAENALGSQGSPLPAGGALAIGVGVIALVGFWLYGGVTRNTTTGEGTFVDVSRPSSDDSGKSSGGSSGGGSSW